MEFLGALTSSNGRGEKEKKINQRWRDRESSFPKDHSLPFAVFDVRQCYRNIYEKSKKIIMAGVSVTLEWL